MSIPGYSKSAKKDDKTVTLLKYILAKHGRVMADYVKSGDKYPNIDGFLELVDENGSPIGKFEVQIKTLQLNHKMKYASMPVSTLEYAYNISDSPVLLIFGDLANSKIYWIHASQEYINNLSIKPIQKSKTIKLKPENAFDIEIDSYIQQWTQIIIAHKNKYNDYLENFCAYEQLKKYFNTELGQRIPYFQDIHHFLDIYNTLLDNDFKIIKNNFFPNCWKLGIAINGYSKNHVSYSIYPIMKDENDLQIRIMSDDDVVNFSQDYTNLTQCQYNPIMTDPKALANNMISEKLTIIFNNTALSLVNHTTEFYSHIVFAFLDEFSKKYKFKDSPAGNESIFGKEYEVRKCMIILYYVLPYYYNLLLKMHNKSTSKNITPPVRNYFDPLYGHKFINRDKQLEDFISEITIQNESYPSVIFENKTIPFGIVYDALNNLVSMKVKTIKRPFIKRSYAKELTNKKTFNLYWNEHDYLLNSNVYVQELYNAYHTLLRTNFPSLYNKLRLKYDVDVYLNIKKQKDITTVSFTAIYMSTETLTPKLCVIIGTTPPSRNELPWKKTSHTVTGELPHFVDKLAIYSHAKEVLHENIKDYLNDEIINISFL